MNYYAIDRSNYISHHGILGMKWGVRRYQNPDGSLTPAGEKRYGKGIGGEKEYQSARRYKPKGFKDKTDRKIYRTMSLVYGKKAANIYQYRVKEKKISREQAAKYARKDKQNEAARRAKIGLAVGAAAAIGLAYLGSKKAITINNMAVASFGAREGLRTVKGGFTLNPSQAIATGKALSAELLRRMSGG